MRPFEAVNCADLGDVPPNPADMMESMGRITSFYETVLTAGILLVTAGGDHLTTLPVLRAVAKPAPTFASNTAPARMPTSLVPPHLADPSASTLTVGYEVKATGWPC